MKYKFTDETKVVDNITLHRIECVTAFGDVECGAKGGWIESEKNLSQCGNAWVCGNAKVGEIRKGFGFAACWGAPSNKQVYIIPIGTRVDED